MISLLTPTPDLDQSIDYYRRLGFSIVGADGRHYAIDAHRIIEISSVRSARPGIKLLGHGWRDKIDQLGPYAEVKGEYIVAHPTGIPIYLAEADYFSLPDRDGKPASILGNYMGISLETIRFAESRAWLELLGWKATMGGEEQGWMALMHDDYGGVSIMKAGACPHMFANPSATYFNGKANLEIIEAIRESGAGIWEEVTHFNDQGIVDNVVLRDPGGVGTFIFSD